MEAQLTVAKPTRESRTMRFNAVMVVVAAILTLIANNELLVDNPKAVAILLLVASIVNLILRRYFTTQPLTRGKQP